MTIFLTDKGLIVLFLLAIIWAFVSISKKYLD